MKSVFIDKHNVIPGYTVVYNDNLLFTTDNNDRWFFFNMFWTLII